MRVACAILLLATVLRADGGSDRQRNQGRSNGGSTQAEFILCAPTDRVPAIAQRHGLTVVQPIDNHDHGIFLVRGPVPRQHHDAIHGDTIDAFAHQLLDQVRADPDVVHFDLNGSSVVTEIGASRRLTASTVEILDSVSRTVTGYFGTQVWAAYVSQPALGVIQLGQAQQIADGRGIIVAVIDTGVDPRHPALAGTLVDGYDFTRDLPGTGSEWTDLDASTVEILDSAGPPVPDPGAPIPVNESTVALVDQATASRVDLSLLPHAFGHGTMVAGLVHLVAPAAKIMPLKVFDAYGNSDIFDIERAIYYAVDHGAKVINMSFSSADATAEMTHAINYAGAHGVICLASAGNSGRSDVVFPAGYRNVMAIGSTSVTDQRSTFTNFGNHLVQFAAPGETLITLYPGGRYAVASGTSFSTAMMSGAAALLSQRVPLLDQRLAGRYFDDGVIRRREWELGNGRVNVYETLRLHGSTDTEPAKPPVPDTTAPTVTLTAPAAGAEVTGTFELSATASDDVGVAGVVFRLDGIEIGNAPTAPFAVSWDSTGTASGAHVLTATAVDTAGNEASSSAGVMVTNDTAAPAVTIVSPSSGARVAGMITVSAAASDNVAVAGVQFTIDGASLGAERTRAPYDVAWNSGSVANGAHVLGAIARDAAGNRRGASVTVTVANDTTAPAVAIASPADGAIVAGTIAFAASAADEVGVAGLQLMVDGVNLGAERVMPPYDVMWNSGSAANGVHVLAAVGRDAAGNQHRASVTITVANDLTAPAITITSPAADATSATETITVAADASDNVGVAGVQFSIDGVNLGTELSAPPFQIAWRSGSVADGAHVIAATARDAAGNRRSASVTVTVFNDTTAPGLAMIEPVVDGTRVTGAIRIEASAWDDVGVLGVQFAIDGINLGAEITAEPYQIEWNAAGAADGAHVVTAVARDAAGNQRTVNVNVIVDNGVR